MKSEKEIRAMLNVVDEPMLNPIMDDKERLEAYWFGIFKALKWVLEE